MENFVLKAKAGINVSAFSETLEQTANSYKFLWLYSLLEILKQREYNIDSPIAYRDIFYSMLRLAQKPCQKFHLSLGATDQLCRYVREIEEVEKNGGNTKRLWVSNDASHLDNSAFAEACLVLSEYVPSRWLHPFVYEHTTDVRGKKPKSQRAITEKIIQAAAAEFKGKNPPPYYIRPASADNEIFIHPKWAKYFKENESIIRGWCLWNFAHYLQKRNPNMPNILNKIIVDETHVRQLTKQRDFWHEVIKYGGSINCIYSGKLLLNKKDFALDHYVPWSFVGHNNLWNLIPADKNVNSSKGDRLPNNQYIDSLVKAHCHALSIHAKHFPNQWKNLVESYCADLKVSFTDLTSEQKMQEAYKTFIPPLIDLAKANRFEYGWVYEPTTSDNL